MSEAERILVIILSVLLGLFLLLGIIALIKVVQVLSYIKRIIEKAEHVVGSVETASAFFQKTAGPVAIGKLIANIADNVMKRKKGGKYE